MIRPHTDEHGDGLESLLLVLVVMQIQLHHNFLHTGASCHQSQSVYSASEQGKEGRRRQCVTNGEVATLQDLTHEQAGKKSAEKRRRPLIPKHTNSFQEKLNHDHKWYASNKNRGLTFDISQRRRRRTRTLGRSAAAAGTGSGARVE